MYLLNLGVKLCYYVDIRKYSDKNRALVNHRRETIRITPSVPNKRDIANIIQHKISLLSH